MSKVSVVVPIYNVGNKLVKCIRSILNQTFDDFELILVNDGSTDHSLQICRQYEKQDQRVHVINKENEGCIVTRRKGVEYSSSRYVMFVDADDWIDKEMVGILYKEAVKHDLDIAVCNSYKVLGSSRLIKRKNNSWYFHEDRIYEDDEIKRHLVPSYLHGHPFPANLFAKLYKRDLLINGGKYLSRINFLGEDLYYNLELFLKAKRVKVMDNPLYYYRTGGITSSYMSYLFDDMVNGYKIQKEVIEEYYPDQKQEHYNGISIMLLNTFKTCLHNVFISKLNPQEIKQLIEAYASNDAVKECLSNAGCKRYFQTEYLNAIKNKDVEYLYRLGEALYRKAKPRKAVLHILSKIC